MNFKAQLDPYKHDVASPGGDLESVMERDGGDRVGTKDFR